MPNLLRRLTAVSLVLALSGCAVKFVEDYDVVLDQGLSDYQGEMAAFMARMAALSGAAEGKYEAPDVQAFYARTSAELQTFVERAEAIDSSGKCVAADYLGRGIKAVVERSAGFIDAQELPLGKYTNVTEIVRSYGEGADEVAMGNCTVVILKVVQDNHGVVQELHKTNGSLPGVIVDIAGPLLDQSVRIAIKNEVVKKNRGDQ